MAFGLIAIVEHMPLSLVPGSTGRGRLGAACRVVEAMVACSSSATLRALRGL